MSKLRVKKRKGLTLLEIIGVLVIITVITALVAFSIPRNVRRGNRESVVSDLQLYGNALQDAYYDNGHPDFDPTTQQAEFETFLSVIEQDYLGVVFKHDSITATDTGFTVTVDTPLDVYEEHYQVWFVTAAGVQKYVMMASGGDNCKIDSAGYASGNYSDDIVMVFSPKQ